MDLGGAVEQALLQSGVTWRRVAVREWGLTGPSGLQIGLAVRAGMLLAQAEVLGPGVVYSERELLRRNRTLRIVRFSLTAAGAVYVQGEIPVAAVSVEEVDRLLGLLVAAAEGVLG